MIKTTKYAYLLQNFSSCEVQKKIKIEVQKKIKNLMEDGYLRLKIGTL